MFNIPNSIMKFLYRSITRTNVYIKNQLATPMLMKKQQKSLFN
jgi:hypothetical protein